MAGNKISERMLNKLRTAHIITQRGVILKPRSPFAGGGWVALDAITKQEIGISSKYPMRVLLQPEHILTVDSKGRVSYVKKENVAG